MPIYLYIFSTWKIRAQYIRLKLTHFRGQGIRLFSSSEVASPSEEGVQQEESSVDDGQGSFGQTVVSPFALAVVIVDLDVECASGHEDGATHKREEDVDPPVDWGAHQVTCNETI